jgi:hypothetical protein
MIGETAKQNPSKRGGQYRIGLGLARREFGALECENKYRAATDNARWALMTLTCRHTFVGFSTFLGGIYDHKIRTRIGANAENTMQTRERRRKKKKKKKKKKILVPGSDRSTVTCMYTSQIDTSSHIAHHASYTSQVCRVSTICFRRRSRWMTAINARIT